MSVVTASGPPFIGLKPVQVALAVRRKPTAMVAIKPQSISCACQATAKKGAGTMEGANIQIATEINAHAHPQIYKGRKPRLRNTFRSGLGRATRAALFMIQLRRHAIRFTMHLIAIPQAARNSARELVGLICHVAIFQFGGGGVEYLQPALEHRRV